MLTPMNPLLLHACKHNYAVPAFNFYNQPTADGITEQAEKSQSPVILMASGRYVLSMGLQHTIALARQAAEKVTIPVAILLDHGGSYEIAEQCANAGFTSVMIDGSRLPIAENTELTRKVVDMAKKYNISVEAELGAVGGIEDAVYEKDEQTKLVLVDPEQAADFVKNTGINALAPAFGNVHGLTTQEPKLDLELLKRVRNATDIPLVLHGGSGLSDETVREIIRIGVAKFNVGTEIKVAWRDGLVEYFNSGKYEPRIATDAAKQSVGKLVAKKITLAGSEGKA